MAQKAEFISAQKGVFVLEEGLYQLDGWTGCVNVPEITKSACISKSDQQ